CALFPESVRGALRGPARRRASLQAFSAGASFATAAQLCDRIAHSSLPTLGSMVRCQESASSAFELGRPCTLSPMDDCIDINGIDYVYAWTVLTQVVTPEPLNPSSTVARSTRQLPCRRR
ncbi:hypothetical protein SPRG_20451, partial [Saprolegnia parasitica CBS 223.65]